MGVREDATQFKIYVPYLKFVFSVGLKINITPCFSFLVELESLQNYICNSIYEHNIFLFGGGVSLSQMDP